LDFLLGLAADMIMHETFSCSILKNINNEVFLKKLKKYTQENPCCSDYPKCLHPKQQSNKELHKSFKEINKSINQAIVKYLKYQPKIIHIHSWAFLTEKNKEINSIRHNHSYNTNKFGISGVCYLTDTSLGTIFTEGCRIQPKLNVWNIFDSRIYHQPENGIPKKDRYVLAFDVSIEI